MVDIVIVGEAYGAEEERQRTPFVGYAGKQLNSMLEEAGINRSDCHVTNVFQLRPDGNRIASLCGTPLESIPGYPPVERGKFIHRRYTSELNRLANEISDVNPNIIILLGNTARWALQGSTGIKNYRGTTELSTHTAIGYKTITTYHPQAINYMATLRPVAILDLMKAKRESLFPEIRRPHREIWIEPTIGDLYDFDARYLNSLPVISVDIETVGRRITCIGFGGPAVALVVPFDDHRKPGGSYWPTKQDERAAWEFVRSVLERRTPKVFQNGLYDISFLWRAYRFRVIGAEHDCMLLHHALQPESLKSLAFLGSIYTDEGAWKQERTWKETTIKRDS